MAIKPTSRLGKIIAALYRRRTGLTNDELADRWGWEYFVTRSRCRAYWHLFFHQTV
ncbi:hypothetical protein C7405_13224 [Paraburkholderia caballeronis]|uniref:hypothetical protein n=1 Tax=Paraburkholderia caballeronis TaxID=416943 RepID=UPI0010D0ADD0|nr:hypothetical protein [Paraburkholderia caballeronis]TDV23329.1 hypothetical protein C7405_13224 [Paraburkholderia caballeronis]